MSGISICYRELILIETPAFAKTNENNFVSANIEDLTQLDLKNWI